MHVAVIHVQEFSISTNGPTSQNKESSSLLLWRSRITNYSGSMRLLLRDPRLFTSPPLAHPLELLIGFPLRGPGWLSCSACRKWEDPGQLFCLERGQFRTQGPGVQLVSYGTHLVTDTEKHRTSDHLRHRQQHTEIVSRALWVVLKLQHPSLDCGRRQGLGGTKPCQWLHYFVEYLNL